MLTKNEKKVIRMLFASLGEPHSINQIARECKLAPNGAFKILKKFEKEGIINARGIANIKSYSLNFENEKTKNILKLALIPELEGRMRYRFDDLKQLKEIAEVCVIFGSYLDKKEPNDLDVLFIIDAKKFNEFKQKSEKVFRTIPVKVHDILQTENDFADNLRKNKISFTILKTGAVLWGQDILVEIVENEYR
ncbi:MAG: hypothetical protein ABH840_04645 [Nanoarchaeota archaeon]